MNIRTVSSLVAGLVFFSAAAHAFPDKQITVIVPFAAGSSPDSVARDFGQALSITSKQPVVIENKVGAEGIIAVQSLMSARADGHTIMVTSSSLPVLDPLMRKNLPYDPVRDFAPICAVARVGNVMNITGSSPFKSAAEVVAAAKAQPGKLTFGYTSTTTRLAAELFQQTTGTKLYGVPYKSSVAAITDVAGGQVDLLFIDPVVGIPFYQTDKVRALVVAGAQRIKSMPDVPSATEAGVPGYSIKPWFGVFASTKTPPAVLAQVRELVALVSKLPAMATDFEKRGLEPMSVCGDDLAKYQTEEVEFWREVIKKAGIEPQ